MAIRTTIDTCLALALTVWAFTCLLPLSLHKAPLAPPCFGTEDSCSACPYHQGSSATGTQHSNSTPNSTTTPQSFTLITPLLCSSSFYNVPLTQGGFSCLLCLLPYLFLVGKPKSCLGAKFAAGKFHCSFTIWTFFWVLLSTDFWRWSILQWWHFIANRH